MLACLPACLLRLPYADNAWTSSLSLCQNFLSQVSLSIFTWWSIFPWSSPRPCAFADVNAVLLKTCTVHPYLYITAMPCSR